jgi:hypothetical protein
VPEISRFYGIVIRMYYNDHAPPHFHAFYGEYSVLIDIHTLAVISGQLTPRALGMVTEWASVHQDELDAVWQQARASEPLSKIAPLP